MILFHCAGVHRQELSATTGKLYFKIGFQSVIAMKGNGNAIHFRFVL